MPETALAVVMTCVENRRNDVDGVDSCTFTVHAVIEPPRDLRGMYTAKIIGPASIADQVISETIFMERHEFFFKTAKKVEPDVKLIIELTLAGPSTFIAAQPGSAV
jgi:hypothetical protein